MAQDIVGSREPTFASDVQVPKGGYGQNGFGGPSSDTPGMNTKSGFLPGPGTPVNNQLRKVPADALPTTFGMRNRKGE